MKETYRKLAIYFLCKSLGVKKEERFTFTNQRNKQNRYYFTDNSFMKEFPDGNARFSNLKLSYIISGKAEVEKC